MPFTQIFQALEVRLNGRTGDPDVYIVDSPLTASYAARGHLMELDPLIDKSRFAPAGDRRRRAIRARSIRRRSAPRCR